MSSNTTTSYSKTDVVEVQTHVTNDEQGSEKLSGIEKDHGSEKELIHSLEYAEIPESPKPGKASEQENPQYVTGAKLVSIVVSICLAAFLMLLDTSIVSTAIPAISDEFHSLQDIGWYSAAYNLGSASFQPLTGKIYNCFSLKWTFITFFAIFEIGSALCGAAQSSIMLIVGRAVAGAGASGLLSGAIIIISCCVPLHRRPPLIGLVQGVAQLGTVIAPLIGGAFTSGYTWRWSFYINLPIGAIVAIPILCLHIPDQMGKRPALKVLSKIHHHLDLIGFALLAPAVIQLLLALEYGGNQFAWNSSQVIGLFIGAFATLTVWVFWNNYKGDDGLIPFSILKRRVVWASALNNAFQMSTLFGTSYWLPIYFQAIKGVSAILSGVYLLPTILGQLVFAVLAGVLVSRVGYIPPFSIYAGVLMSIGCGLFSLFRPDTSTRKWVGFQIIASCGRGAGLQMPIVAVQNAVSQKDLSPAMALLLWAQYIGPTIFLTLYNTLFNASLKSLLPKQAPNVDAQAVLSAGARHFRDVVDPRDLYNVLIAYSDSLDRVFYLVASAGVGAFLAAWGMGWRDTRKNVKEINQNKTAEP
ncbi:major facilitator superfamily domain-containing protein [Annulohypoxylon truncatum]|uniref:major facilitator superfamily domain-containing protein n=1 Tax=Annulohypoxylon truncatum TaxID=327061 RepID=UPI0020072BA0|nr:major facilitator superfamily domain-containing protein [Annulohypoxylon truncatum]KAI1208403.1 major facilitator superfamily domain-containing protein [Annulohypoxylon truncatum]